MEQALVQKIVCTGKVAYLAYILNRTKNSKNYTVVGLLTHLQENYGQLMPHELLEWEDVYKKTIYNLREPIAAVFLTVK